MESYASGVIIQLLTIAIPKLEELQKDGEDGRKKIQEYTRYTTVGLALIESSAMAIGFGRQGLLIDYNAWNIIIAIVTMTTGSALLMWIGEQITEKGVGNGISIVLLFNILSSVPDDMKTLYYRFIFGQTVTKMIFSVVVIALIILAMVVFVIVLNDAERRIPVQYSKKMVGRKMVGGQASNIPLKINTAGVMPVIFASVSYTHLDVYKRQHPGLRKFARTLPESRLLSLRRLTHNAKGDIYRGKKFEKDPYR